MNNYIKHDSADMRPGSEYFQSQIYSSAQNSDSQINDSSQIKASFFKDRKHPFDDFCNVDIESSDASSNREKVEDLQEFVHDGTNDDFWAGGECSDELRQNEIEPEPPLICPTSRSL